MAPTNRDEPRYAKLSVGLAIFLFVVLAALWILFVTGLKLQEMVVGVAAVGAALAFLMMVYRSEPQRLDLRWRDLATGWRIPGYALHDCAILLRVLFKDLLGIERAGSYYRVSGFETAKRNPQRVMRRVLATAYTTFAPNSIVIGIDPETSRMLQHQLERSATTRMARDLGARS